MYNDAKAEAVDQLRRDSLYESANHERYLAEGLAVAGVGCAGLAVWLFVRPHGARAETTVAGRTRLMLVPTRSGDRRGRAALRVIAHRPVVRSNHDAEAQHWTRVAVLHTQPAVDREPDLRRMHVSQSDHRNHACRKYYVRRIDLL